MKFVYKTESMIWGAMVAALALMVSCSDDSPTQTNMGSSLVCSSKDDCSDAKLKDGFALIKSSGNYVELGTNSKSAKANDVVF